MPDWTWTSPSFLYWFSEQGLPQRGQVSLSLVVSPSQQPTIFSSIGGASSKLDVKAASTHLEVDKSEKNEGVDKNDSPRSLISFAVSWDRNDEEHEHKKKVVLDINRKNITTEASPSVNIEVGVMAEVDANQLVAAGMLLLGTVRLEASQVLLPLLALTGFDDSTACPASLDSLLVFPVAFPLPPIDPSDEAAIENLAGYDDDTGDAGAEEDAPPPPDNVTFSFSSFRPFASHDRQLTTTPHYKADGEGETRKKEKGKVK